MSKIGFARTSVKQRGRALAVDELRSRCLEQIRKGREQLLSRCREAPDESAFCDGTALQSLARDVVARECLRELERLDGGVDGEDFLHWEDLLAMEQRVALEEVLLAELHLEDLQLGAREVANVEAARHVADCDIAARHDLLGSVVSCPLCSSGHLGIRGGALRCTGCSNMDLAFLDGEMPLEDVAELLADAEWRHASAGCAQRPIFEVRRDMSSKSLFLRCGGCGWSELVL